MKDEIVDGIPKDYNIFSKAEDDSDMDYLNDLFNQAVAGVDASESNVISDAPEKNNSELPEVAATSESITEEQMQDAFQDNTIDDDLLNAVLAEDQEKNTDDMDSIIPDIKDFSLTNQEDEANDIPENNQDILDLINEINSSEELPPEVIEDEEPEVKNNTDVGDIYSDALGAVSTLNDKDDLQIDDDLLSMIPDVSEPPAADEAKVEVKKKKKGFFKRIFGNIREERTEEEKEALKAAAIQEAEKKEAEEKAKEEQAKAEKERLKAQKAEEKKKAQEEAAKKKEENKKKAQAKKAEKEQRSREIQELVDEIDDNEGKINKVGAGIVFALFAALAVVIVIGTNIYSYSICIKNATKNFEIQHYNEAYRSVYGIDIKDKDIEIYDKIMTVMYVNKQLNSFENYYELGRYPEALDSLLKGLQRYDKYYTLATMLGIVSDMNYVRSEILDQLATTFHVTEEEALNLLAKEDQQEYSLAVYDLAAERVQISAQDTKKE